MTDDRAEKPLPTRAATKAALAAAGWSARKIAALFTHGWRGVATEAEADAAEAQERAEAEAAELRQANAVLAAINEHLQTPAE